MRLADYLAANYLDKKGSDKKKKRKRRDSPLAAGDKSEKTVTDAVIAPEPAGVHDHARRTRPTGTVYRDSSGKIVNEQTWLALHKSQGSKNPQTAANVAPHQQRETEQAHRRLQEAASLSLNQFATDKAVNEKLKSRARADDPLAPQVPESSIDAEEEKSAVGLPLYLYAFPPNRFDIAPGYKWDGVDRSNGFEDKWLEVHTK